MHGGGVMYDGGGVMNDLKGAEEPVHRRVLCSLGAQLMNGLL